ncbi:hypothetical protein VTK56DRAFT_6929 [Thermocarpiscus australiensis]
MSESRDGLHFPPNPPQTQPRRGWIDTGDEGHGQNSLDPGTIRKEDQAVRTFTELRFVPFQPRDERQSERPRRSTGPPDDESRAIREASRQRLAEQRRRERGFIQQQREVIRWMEEEERRRQQTETIRHQDEGRRRQHEERYIHEGEEERRRQHEKWCISAGIKSNQIKSGP